jgi:AraC-like DNA-binding protein
VLARSTLEELAKDPAGRYTRGDSWIHFCAAPTLWGVILWARTPDDEAVRLGQSLVLELSPPAQPHASLIDCSRLDGADPSSFQMAERYLTRYSEVLKEYVLRVALVRPSGMKGAIVAGAYDVLPKPYPVEVFKDVTSAWKWLGGAGKNGWPSTPKFLDDANVEATGTPPMLSELRAWLDAHLQSAELADAAKALKLSERTLQRKLLDSKVTFTGEVAEARLRAAKRMLADTDAKLTSIAVEVGFSSLQHFSALFRRRLAMSPSAFRQSLSRRKPPRVQGAWKQRRPH